MITQENNSTTLKVLNKPLPFDRTKKYVSDLFVPEKLQMDRLNVIYAPMGSGKTHLIKELLKKNKCLMVTPYRSSRDDFGLSYNFSKSKDGLDYEFLYPSDLIHAVTKDWSDSVDLTNEKAIEAAAIDYVSNMPPVTFTHILFDEVDFMWTQAQMTWIGDSTRKTRSEKIWEYILKALSSKFILIGQTSTLIPSLGLLPMECQLLTDAYTSVRFDSITPILVHKDVTHDQLFVAAMNESMSDGEQKPTLVYKRRFSGSDIKYMGKMVNQGKRVLVVLREENSPKKIMDNKLLVDELTEIGAIEVVTDNTPETGCLYFKVIGHDTGLDKITLSVDPFEFFDYVFVNTSSSRQVSLNAVHGNPELKVSVITIDSKLNSTTHQVAGRFRQNRVVILHYLKGYTKKDISSFSGQALWEKLRRIDPFVRRYMEHSGVSYPKTGVIKSNESLVGIAERAQKHRKAQWIARSVKGKANQKSTHKFGVFKSWVESRVDSGLNFMQKVLFKEYDTYCISNDETSYSKNIFASKLKEVKHKQQKLLEASTYS